MNSIYKREKLKKLSKFTVIHEGATSLFEGLSLVDYIMTRQTICIAEHSQPCQDCLGLLNIAKVVVNEGYWKMKDAFKCLAEHVQPCAACPENVGNTVTHKKPIKHSDSINMANNSSQHAKRKFLQMPLAAINVKTGEKESKVFLVDKYANLTLLHSLLCKLSLEKDKRNKLSKETFKALIQSCSSDAERDKLRYVVAETSGLSQRQLTHQFGNSSSVDRKAKIEHTLARALEIRKNVQELSQIKEEAVLVSLGFELPEINSDIHVTDSSSESESDPDAEVEHDSIQQQSLHSNTDLAHQYCENEEELNTASFRKRGPYELLGSF
jgi:hypothetical protein